LPETRTKYRNSRAVSRKSNDAKGFPLSRRQAAKLRKILTSIPFEPYYEGPDFILYHGDCIQLLRAIKENSIDMIFEDPPYHINKCYWDKSLGVERDFESQLEWIEVVKVVLKADGSIWITGTHHSIHQCGFALQKLGFKIINDIVWFKPNGKPDCSRRCFSASHEILLWAKKSKDAKHVYNYQLMKRRLWPGDMFKKPGKQMKAIWLYPRPVYRKNARENTRRKSRFPC